MKKLFYLLSIVLAITTLLCSCSVIRNTDTISSVIIDDKEYKTIYLYSFKDAKIDNYKDSSSNTNDTKPTATGFVYSTQKLLPGSKISVWENCYFYENEYYSNDGTIAIVDEKIETYHIKVQHKDDTYIIEYYGAPWMYTNTASKREDLDLNAQKIEIVKERVIIKYEYES